MRTVVCVVVEQVTAGKDQFKVKTRQKMIAGFAAAAAVLGIGGAIAAAHAIGDASTAAPLVQGPAPAAPAPDHSNGPDVPGQPDLPEPGDAPDAPGQ
jgi:hypothetical protein